MKKMKRALSLLLTAVMLLGMFVVPTGAASTTSFTDAELIENTEAVQITSGIGLFAGTTDGRFAPKATVTRAQMATIIVKMLRGNEFNADAFKGVGVNPFPDTASFEGGWAEGYINACSQLGVVAGYGDGTFKPGRELTTAEAITMIINALGIDPGPGDWPVNYMAKAEAMKLYGDLATKPATNDPLNRDQLAVIVWEGMKYSPAGKSGYKIPGSDLVFADVTDAILANGKRFEGITEAVGTDSLASKVYELKPVSGWITGNTATGGDCTVLTLADGSEEYYAVDTGVDMLGHYVTIYYKEQYKNDEEPGKVYTVVDESTVVTVKEAITTSKKYKEVFGKSIDEAANGLLLSNDYTITEKLSDNMDISGYTAGSRAPKGTYIIAEGTIVAYIAPVNVYASYIVDIGTVEDYENIWVSNANGDVGIPNTEGYDQVVEYAGMKIGDYVTYRMVQGMYVLDPVIAVTGMVTKTLQTEYYGSNYDTIALDGTEYMAFGGTNQLGSKLDTRLDQVEYGQMYKLYITGDNRYVGFEKTSGGVSMDTTAFMLGSIIVKEKDQYGKTTFVTKARGIDMGGSEIMLPIGKAKDTDGNNRFDFGTDETVGSMNQVLQGFYNYVESTEKEAKKEGLYELTAFGAVYSPDTPTYALKPITTSTIFTGTNTVATAEGIAALGTAGMKFFVLGGGLNDSEPLSVSSGIPSAFYPTKEQAVNSYMLVTRQPHGALSNINIWIYLSDDKTGKEVPFYVTNEQLEEPGVTADGTVYTVWSASTGDEMELIMDPEYGVTLTQPGMFVARQDEEGLVFAVEKVAESTTPKFDDEKAQIVTNIGFWGLTTNRLRGERLASVSGGSGVAIDMINNWNNGAASAKVIDLRTEEEIKASGVGKITSLKQMVTMRENDPGLIVIYDLYIEDASNGTSGTTKTVFITKAHRRTVGMNSVVYAFEEPVSGDEMMVVRSLSATMGDRVRVNFEACRNGGPGFYRYCVDADGKLSLIPYDDKALSVGNYGMFAMHDEVVDVEVIDSATMQVTTANAVTPDCGYNCAHAGEPRKEFVITAATTTILDTDGTRIPFETFDDLFQNNSLIINYYCDTPVNYSSYADDMDTSAELIVISSRTEVFVSCDGSCQNGTPVDSASDITGAGKYYLTADLSENITISSGDVELCLNGHSINGTATVSGGQLTLTNCASRDGGNVTGGLKVNGGKAILNDAVFATGVTVASDATFEMKGGKVTGAETSGVINNGTFIMSGGTITGNKASVGAGVNNAGTFTMTGGSITGNTATGNGGGINTTAGTVTIDGGSIAGNTIGNGKFGGGIFINGGSVTMNSGSIAGNIASGSAKGIGVNIAKGTFTMNGGTISGHSTTSTGGGVQVNGGTFNLAGGSITGNTVATYGGGVCVQTGTFNMTGGTVAGNMHTNADGAGQDVANGYYSTDGLGGAITISGGTIGTAGEDARTLVVNASTATVKGSAVINGNVATTGTSKAATLNIQGGTFNGNVINGDYANGGYLNAAKKTFACTLNISGGTFNGDVAKGSGEWQTGITLGTVTTAITGGTFNSDVSDATISGICELNGTVNNSTITGGTHSGNWTVGTDVTITSGTFVGKNVADLADANIADGLTVEQVGSNVEVKYAFVSIDSNKAEPCAGTLHGLSLTEGGEIFGGANYYLASDITDGITVKGSGEISLCLNGHKITTNGTAAISVDSGVTLHLCNCSASAGNIKGGAAGAAMVIAGGTVKMYNNVHVDGGTYSAQGAVVINSGNFTMNGGTISGNTVTSPATGAQGNYAGGLYVKGGTATLAGGEISNNSASNRTHANSTTNTSAFCGGGVAADAGTLNITGTAIYGNYAIVEAQIGNNGAAQWNYSYAGGGVCLGSGAPALNMYGGIVAGNWAEVGTVVANQTYKIAAGGIYVHNNQTANISGGVVGGDTAVVVSGGRPTNLGINTGNYSHISGGGIAARGTVNLNGTAVVKGNTGYSGGGVHIFSAGVRVLNVSGNATITNNTSTWRGGGVYLGTGATANISGSAVISSNTSAHDGGGVAAEGATIKMTGGKIINNTATGALNGGGGVALVSSAKGEFTGGEIKGNACNIAATEDLIVSASSSYKIAGATIEKYWANGTKLP